MTPVETGAVTREISVAAPPETVFPYFTDPDRMTRWMGTEADLDARPGGVFNVTVAGSHIALGEYVEVDPPSRVVFTWGWEDDDTAVPPGTSTVEITLTPDGEGTKVVLVHRGLPEEGPGGADAHAHGWEHYLGRLEIAGAGGDAGPDRGPEGMD
jgi:uncharacterized protein YndB with AHSA1/START domain